MVIASSFALSRPLNTRMLQLGLESAPVKSGTQKRRSYFLGIANGFTSPQLAASHLPAPSMSIRSGLPVALELIVICMVNASGLVIVVCPSPLLGGLVQVKAIFQVFPTRGDWVCVQPGCCGAV